MKPIHTFAFLCLITTSTIVFGNTNVPFECYLAQDVQAENYQAIDYLDDTIYIDRNPVLSTNHIKKAQVTQGALGEYDVEIRLTQEGSEVLAALTRKHTGKQIAIFVNGNIASAPKIRSEVTGGRMVLGLHDKTEDDPKRIAATLSPSAQRGWTNVVGWILYVITAGLFLYQLYCTIMTSIAAKRTTVEREEHVNLLSITICETLLLAPIVCISSVGILSRLHLLWMLPAWLISHPMTIAAHQVVLQKRMAGVLSKLIVAIVAGGLTILQYFLIGEHGLWAFIMVGPIPIPIFGITFVVTSIATFVGIHTCIVAMIYLPLRRALGVK